MCVQRAGSCISKFRDEKDFIFYLAQTAGVLPIHYEREKKLALYKGGAMFLNLRETIF
jgi:hypothetical protein